MKHLFQSNFCIEFSLKKSYLHIIIQSQIKMLGLMKLIDYKITLSLLSDLLPLAEAVFLELPGLEWDLSVCLSVCSDGHWLPGVSVLCHSETPAEKHYGAHANPRPHYSSQGEILLQQAPRVCNAYATHYWKVFK